MPTRRLQSIWASRSPPSVRELPAVGWPVSPLDPARRTGDRIERRAGGPLNPLLLPRGSMRFRRAQWEGSFSKSNRPGASLHRFLNVRPWLHRNQVEPRVHLLEADGARLRFATVEDVASPA